MANEAYNHSTVDTGVETGVDFLEIAEVYPVPPDPKWAGASEEIVGRCLASRPPESLLIATKVAGPGGGWFQAPVRQGRTALDRHSIARAVEGSLKRLGTD